MRALQCKQALSSKDLSRKEQRQLKDKAGERYFHFRFGSKGGSELLGEGDEGAEVKTLQAFLRGEGYFTHPIDTGYFGALTGE